MRQREVYKRITEAAEAQKLDAAAVEGLSADAVKALAGATAEPVTATLLANMQRSAAAGLRQKEMEAAAGWVAAQVRTRYPQAAAVFRRGRVIEVWLDGVPKEVE